MTNEKTAEPVAERWGRSAEGDAQLRAQDAANLRKGLLWGLAGGVGAGGLYYLSQYLKDKTKAVTHVPAAEEIAAAPITEVAAPEPEEEAVLPVKLPEFKFSPAIKAAFDKNLLLFPAVGAGAGALIGHARGEKGKKNRNALLGATLGAAGGLGVGAITSKPVFEMLSKSIPRNYEDLWRGSEDAVPAETGLHGGFRNVLGLTLPAAGAYGGLTLADAAMQQDSGKRNRDAVQAARKEYFNALVGKEDADEKLDEEEKKSASAGSNLDAFLNGAFKAYQEKKANRTWAEWLHDITMPSNELAHTLMIGGGLGAGAIGAKYMYDKTKAQSAARNRERARAARERMQGLTAPWVDPRELADVKALAAAGGPAARGV